MQWRPRRKKWATTEGAGRVRPSIGRQTVTGDGSAIGGGHVPHAVRRNVDIIYLLFDNGIYGLDKGQTASTAAVGFRTPASPYDNFERPLNPLLMQLETLALGHCFGAELPTRGDSLDRLIEKAGGEIVAKAAMVKSARKTVRR